MTCEINILNNAPIANSAKPIITHLAYNIFAVRMMKNDYVITKY